MATKLLSATVEENQTQKTYLFGENGDVGTKQRRNSPRSGKTNKGTDKETKEAIEAEGFDEENCQANQWLVSFLEKKISRKVIRGIASLVSAICDLQLNREYYRKKYTLLYWLEQHLNEIRMAFSTKKVKLSYMKGNDKCETPIPPPYLITTTEQNSFPIPFSQTNPSIEDTQQSSQATDPSSWQQSDADSSPVLPSNTFILAQGNYFDELNEELSNNEDYYIDQQEEVEYVF